MSLRVRGPGGFVVALTTAAVLCFLALPVSTQEPGRRGRIVRVNGAEAVEGEVLLKYRDDRIAASHAAIEAAADADIVETLDRRGMRRMQSRRLRTSELLSLLAQDPDVEYAEPNYVIRLLAVPNDPSFTSLWGLFNNGFNPVGGGGVSGADIDAPGAWDISTGTRGAVVAVLDTGIDYTHADLAPNMWPAPSQFQVTIGGVTITCAAGTFGFNAVARTCNPMDDQYHGTHASGTVGAKGNNGGGVTGVNWTTSMMAIKVLSSTGNGLVSDAVAGLEFAMQAKTVFSSSNGADIRVLSNSWGSSGYSASLQNAIAAAANYQMLFVAAAGNNGSNNDSAPIYPASYPTSNMVSVAASTNADQRASFSNYGANSVHLAAPGTAILSTVPNNGYAIAQGTSMAAPHVSGAAMLALSMCSLNTLQLKSLLLSSVDLVPAFSGITTTGGRLNVKTMLQNCPYRKVTGLTLTSNLASPQALGKTVTWTATPSGGQAPYAYRWWVETSPGLWWNGGWGASNTFAWTPTTANSAYRVLVQVKSAWNEEGVEFSVAKTFAINTPVSGATLTSNVSSPQAPGTTITWTASATGGTAPHQYQFQVWNGSTWTLGRAWGVSNTFAWTPNTPNSAYSVLVQVRSAWNQGASEFSLAKPFVIGAPATSVALNANKTSPQFLGAVVMWTASVTGGEAPYQYQWSVWNGSTYTVVSPWSSSYLYYWAPSVANPNYRVVVQVRSAWNSGVAEISASRVFPIMSTVSAVSLTPDIAAPRPTGTTVTFTAGATGGSGQYHYQWSVRGVGGWAVVTPWSTSQVFAWTPTVPYDSYAVRVEARSSWSTGAAEAVLAISYPIKPIVTAATLVPNLSSPRASGSTIRWTASASGGQAPYQYRWAVFDGSVWTDVTGWSTSTTYDWTPTTANGNYKVGVRVRGSWNTGGAEFTAIQPFVIQ